MNYNIYKNGNIVMRDIMDMTPTEFYGELLCMFSDNDLHPTDSGDWECVGNTEMARTFANYRTESVYVLFYSDLDRGIKNNYLKLYAI